MAVLLCVLSLTTSVGCGTSRSHASSTTKTSATATAPATLSTTRTATETGTQTTTPTTSETATGTPPTGTETTTNPGAPASGGAPPRENARIPAMFTIGPGGAVTPPTITAPAHLPVQVTVISGDGRAHKAVLHTPIVYVLAVPAHGRATVLIANLKAGRYPLVVDGTARGALAIGGAPGP
jgi:hypothetical protein